MRAFLALIVILIGAAAAAVYSSAFIVHQNQLPGGRAIKAIHGVPSSHSLGPGCDNRGQGSTRLL